MRRTKHFIQLVTTGRALTLLCSLAVAATADQNKVVHVWIDVEDPLLRPGESTKVTVWAMITPGPGSPVAYWLSSINKWFPGIVQG